MILLINTNLNKIVVVEGKNDYSKIKEVFPKLNILITGGSAINEDFLNMLERLSKSNEIILFLDPDGPGEKIRSIISNRIPTCSHIFAPKKESISKNKKKIGVEHLPKETIKLLFEKIYKVEENKNIIDINDLYDLGLISGKNSSIKREYLCSKLNLGHTNGKRLKERLEIFNISIKKVREIINEKYH